MEAQPDVSSSQSTICPEDKPNAKHLKEVHKKYRGIEGSRRAYHGESEGILRRQEASLANLRADNISLRQTVETYKIQDCAKEMAELRAEADKFTVLLETDEKQFEDLECSIEDLYSKEYDARKEMGGIFAGHDKYRKQAIFIQILENRLAKARTNLDVIYGENSSLQKRINDIKDEKEYYNNIRVKMENELQAKEKKMGRCIEESNMLYEERDDFEERITDLLEIREDLEAHILWNETEGWICQDPIPLAQIATNLVQHNEFYEKDVIPAKETSLHYREWVDAKALGNIQDVLNVEISGVVEAVKVAEKNALEVLDHVNLLAKEMNDLDAAMMGNTGNKFKMKKIEVDTKAKLVNRKLDMETTMESILDILKDLNLEDEEFLPVIKEMKKQVTIVFREAGCNIPDEEVAYDGQPVVKTAAGQSIPLEAALIDWFSTIERFLDRLTGTLS